jgi:hypothetical protein
MTGPPAPGDSLGRTLDAALDSLMSRPGVSRLDSLRALRGLGGRADTSRIVRPGLGDTSRVTRPFSPADSARILRPGALGDTTRVPRPVAPPDTGRAIRPGEPVEPR